MTSVTQELPVTAQDTRKKAVDDEFITKIKEVLKNT